MDFYGYIEKVEFESMIKDAKKVCINEALAKLKNFDPMNETFFKAAMPDNTPRALIKKRTNKLARMKHKKDLKKIMGHVS